MDQLKQYWAIAKKQHFWILCGFVVLVPFIVFWVASGHLATVFGDQMGKIKRASGEVAALSNSSDHPNEGWVSHVKEETEKLRTHVKDAWASLYKQQQAVLKWPVDLKPDFIAAFNKPAEADDPRALEPLCERYQNFVKTELSQMADIVKAKWNPESGGHGGNIPKIGHNGVPIADAGEADKTYIVYWDPSDQARLVDAYDWQDPPSPMDVRYAQEELWVLQAICNAVDRTNVGATGDFDAVVREIHSTLIGYDATNKFPLGEGANRIERLHKTGAGGIMPGTVGAPSPTGVPGGPAAAALEPVRPVRHRTTDEGSLGSGHPKFAGGGFVGMPGGPMPGGAPAGPVDPDAWLKDGRFVDIKGKPLLGSDWANSTTPEYNLMAFKLVIVADEQRWQKLLVELCNSPLPLEVREVRINASDREGGAGPAPFPHGQGGHQQGDQDNTMHNVTLEIHGVAYLMNNPLTAANLAKLGFTAANAAPGAAPVTPPVAAPSVAAPPAAATPPAPASGAPTPATGPVAPPTGAPAATTTPAPPSAVPPITAPPPTATIPSTGPPATTPKTAPPIAAPTTTPPAKAPPSK